MIQVESLRKEYGDLTAVAGIDFVAEPGAIFGLLGPNGAGKSTTIGCISGLVSPTGGRILVDGHDIVRDGRAAKAGLGIVDARLRASGQARVAEVHEAPRPDPPDLLPRQRVTGHHTRQVEHLSDIWPAPTEAQSNGVGNAHWDEAFRD